MNLFHISYDKLCGFDNLHRAWRECKSGKTDKDDIVAFERHLEENLISLYDDLKLKRYAHGAYEYFPVFDGKKRDIYKATMSDRVVHQLLYCYLTLLYRFDFITDSYASLVGKGTHRAIGAAQYFCKLAQNGNESPCFILKCDIRAYFNSMNHEILLAEIQKKIQDPDTFCLIQAVIQSFHAKDSNMVGIPLGNVTSQIFANIYLHPLDIYVKQILRERYYVRYNDDFLIVGNNKKHLEQMTVQIRTFLAKKLQLELPEEKMSIRKLAWGVDFLGYVLLPNATVVRDSTKAKILNNIEPKSLSSYMGIFQHANAHGLRQKVLANKHLRRKSDYDIM